MNNKESGLIYSFASLYYIIMELVCALNFKDTLFNTYTFHTISELGIPNSNSPLFFLMNSAFILIGLTVIFNNFTKFKDFITRNKIIFYVLTLVTGIGVIIVGLIHGGNPITSGYHTLGAVMSILGGNILLIIISKSTTNFKKYEKITYILGIIGLTAFWIMFFILGNKYMPVFERISVYTTVLWNLITGIYLLRSN